MRLIGTMPTDTDATRFGDYLLSIAMPNHVEAGRDGSWQVWIDHDDHIEQATSQLHAYVANPNDPKYAAATSAAIKLRREAAGAAERRRRKHIDVRTSWSGVIIRPTPVTIALVITCLVVGVLTRFGMSSDNEQAKTFVDALLFQPMSALFEENGPFNYTVHLGHGHLSSMFWSIGHGQVWRLITPIFLHGGLLHLFFNLSWLVTLGSMIESRKGAIFLLLLVIGAAILSNCGEALWAVYRPVGAHNADVSIAFGWVAFGGFSGVNYALFGYAWMKGRFQPYEHIGVGPQTVGLMLGWLVLCMTGLLGPIANAAHFVGLIVGAGIGYAPTWMRKIKTR